MRRLALLLLLALAGACSAPRTSPREAFAPAVVARFGGAVHAVAEARRRIYRAVGGAIEVATLDDPAPRGRVELSADARIAALLVHEGDLYALLLDRAVVRLLLAEPDAPLPEASWDAEGLGAAPRRLAVLDGRVVALGAHAVVALDGTALARREEIRIASAVRAGDALVVAGDRRILEAQTGALLGSADEIVPAGDAAGLPAPFVFLRHGAAVDSFGLLEADLRETNHERCTIERSERVEGVRAIDGRIWAWTARAVTAFVMHEGRLRPVRRIDRTDVRDLLVAADGRIVLAGPFGTEVHDAVGGAPRRAPTLGGIEAARGDGRSVILRTADGAWRIDESGAPVPTDAPVPATTPPALLATAGARATLAPDGTVTATGSGGLPIVRSLVAPIRAAAAIAGDFWIADDAGLVVLSGAAADAGRLRARLELPGPAVALVPRLDGTVLVVTRDDGVLVVDPAGAPRR